MADQFPLVSDQMGDRLASSVGRSLTGAFLLSRSRWGARSSVRRREPDVAGREAVRRSYAFGAAATTGYSVDFHIAVTPLEVTCDTCDREGRSRRMTSNAEFSPRCLQHEMKLRCNRRSDNGLVKTSG